MPAQELIEMPGADIGCNLDLDQSGMSALGFPWRPATRREMRHGNPDQSSSPLDATFRSFGCVRIQNGRGVADRRLCAHVHLRSNRGDAEQGNEEYTLWLLPSSQ
jgi:hypothetical protein